MKHINFIIIIHIEIVYIFGNIIISKVITCVEEFYFHTLHVCKTSRCSNRNNYVIDQIFKYKVFVFKIVHKKWVSIRVTYTGGSQVPTTNDKSRSS